MKNKKYIIGGVIISIGLIYFFVPPLVDFYRGGSRYNQWKNRSNKKSIKTEVAVEK